MASHLLTKPLIFCIIKDTKENTILIYLLECFVNGGSIIAIGNTTHSGSLNFSSLPAEGVVLIANDFLVKAAALVLEVSTGFCSLISRPVLL